MEEIETINSELVTKKIYNRFFENQDVTSAKTIYAYTFAIQKFYNFLIDNNLVLSDINNPLLLKYRNELIKNNYALASIDFYIVVLKKFIYYLFENEIIKDFNLKISPLKKDKLHSRLPLNLEQIKALLSVINPITIIGKRDMAIIYLMLKCGLRGIEVSRINLEDLKTRNGRIILKVQGKGHLRKDENIPIPTKVHAYIVDYLKAESNMKCEGPLFLSHSQRSYGQRVSVIAVSWIVKKYLCLINLGASHSAHSLRHSFASQLVSLGIDKSRVSSALRHKSMATSEIYYFEAAKKRELDDPVNYALDAIF